VSLFLGDFFLLVGFQSENIMDPKSERREEKERVETEKMRHQFLKIQLYFVVCVRAFHPHLFFLLLFAVGL